MADSKIRAQVIKTPSVRLRTELINGQSVLSSDEVEKLERKVLVAMIVLLRSNKTSSVMTSFDPSSVLIHDEDNFEPIRAGSVGDDMTTAEGRTVVGSPLTISEPLLTSMLPSVSRLSSGAAVTGLSFENFLMLQESNRIREREEREEERRVLREEKEAERKRVEVENKRVEVENRKVEDERRQLEREQMRLEREALDSLLRSTKEDERMREKERVTRELIFREEDRVSREADRVERVTKDNRFELRLKRAIDITHGRISNFPTIVTQMTGFFSSCESLMNGFAIDADLRVSLISSHLDVRSQKIVMALGPNVTYEEMKRAVISEHNLNPSLFRSCFTKAKIAQAESCVQYVSRITNSLRMYLDSRQIGNSFQDLFDLCVVDKLVDSLDTSARLHLCDWEASQQGGWIRARRAAEYMDCYYSLRDPARLVSGRSSNISRGGGGGYSYVRSDRSRLFCLRCQRSGHVASTCYSKLGVREEAKDNTKQSNTKSVRRCYLCNSDRHLANTCNSAKKKAFKVKRVVVESDSVAGSELDPVLKFDCLLKTQGVSDDAEGVEFHPIDLVNDIRVNSCTGMPGFIPRVMNAGESVGGAGDACSLKGGGSCLVGGGIASLGKSTRGVVGGVSLGGSIGNGAVRMQDLLGEASACSTAADKSDLILNVKVADKDVTFLLDSGADISIIKSCHLSPDVDLSEANHIRLIGAFGKAVDSAVLEVYAKLEDGEERDVVKIKLAVCDELNGDWALLTVADYVKLCNTEEMCIPKVLVAGNTGRICPVTCDQVDVATLQDSIILSDNDQSQVKSGASFDHAALVKLNLSDESYEAFKKEQEEDSTLISCWSKVKELNTAFVINPDNKLLYRQDVLAGNEILQLVLPEGRRRRVMECAHDSNWANHFGSSKTIERIKAWFFWSEMNNDVKRYVQSCVACQRKSRATKMDRIPIKASAHEVVPFEMVACDVIGPLVPSSSKGHKYILCLIDYASRWVEATPLKTLTSRETCDALVQMFTRIGIPRVLVSDNGNNFVAGLNKELYARLGIEMRNST